MRLVIFNWRELGHPKAGGAELATHRLAKGLAASGHGVTLFTSHYEGAQPENKRDGYRVVRRGTEVTCRLHAAKWLVQHQESIDVVIDEVNTLPFFSRVLTRKPVVVWIHQLAREVWLSEAPPIIGRLGYLLEPALMRIYRNVPSVTVSRSSAVSLADFGFRGPISVVENALEPPALQGNAPVPGLVGYVGRITPSKRVKDIISAVSIARKRIPYVRLAIVGSGSDAALKELQKHAEHTGIRDCVTFHGRKSDQERDDILSSLDLLALASMREGWGLVVSEAARFGVPSVVYPVPGLVDSVQDGHTGIVVSRQAPEELAIAICRVVQNRVLRQRFGEESRQYIKQFTEKRFIDGFEQALLAASVS